MLQQERIYIPQIKKKYHYCLHKLFDNPSVVCIGGIWKSGKTDFALYIAETLKQLGIITEIASNIDTKDTFPMITDLITLRHWLYETNKRKLYIFDEANIHLPSRRAMSGKNVEIIRIFGEVSKAHARMIFIAQNLMRVDKELLDETWVRGVFIKRNLKKAQLISHLLSRNYTFRNIPPCATPFDPYAVAPFSEKPKGNIAFKDSDLQFLWDSVNGTLTNLSTAERVRLHRIRKKFIKETLEQRLQVTS